MTMDKRIIKTRTNIKKAFIELAEEQPISKISVSDLSAKAHVNRSTFYLHYRDVPSVAADIEKEIEQSIAQCMDGFTVSDIYGSTYSFFQKLTKRLDENDGMKRYIIFSTNSVQVILKIKQILVEKTADSILKRFPTIDIKKINYPLTYAAAGIVDCYVKWVSDNDAQTSMDELMKEVSEITEYIISHLTKFAFGR